MSAGQNLKNRYFLSIRKIISLEMNNFACKYWAIFQWSYRKIITSKDVFNSLILWHSLSIRNTQVQLYILPASRNLNIGLSSPGLLSYTQDYQLDKIPLHLSRFLHFQKISFYFCYDEKIKQILKPPSFSRKWNFYFPAKHSNYRDLWAGHEPCNAWARVWILGLQYLSWKSGSIWIKSNRNTIEMPPPPIVTAPILTDFKEFQMYG